ncbi:lycopene cyclase domain-containing protein [Microbacterium invictum]|uniref:Lycopene cyclase domain-containing protein n=1 Tax=Microbacterium invictum TaxID=515415 RepID=A0ABZ0VFD7_9MICO|nr:lycopene cyclase domain-containing protein [Microbacterium invictum]WQB71824.1 lycopene cyclase domain-containing protein [Microbacterium invictum]
MTYTLISIPFVLLAAGVTLATARRPRFRERMVASLAGAVVLVILTAIFDNVIIGTGLVAYDEEHRSGILIGLAPIEDFLYAIAAAFLVPAVHTLMTARRVPEETA